MRSQTTSGRGRTSPAPSPKRRGCRRQLPGGKRHADPRRPHLRVADQGLEYVREADSCRPFGEPTRWLL